ncbi:hypothetical protein P4637_03205 [Halalkalibacterium halodurans]|uniref:hypothetical protein n=1 Tax=Halalkalibacterium halodurans TaxID=86665 RepID=UPI002E1D87CB|nr:hypothetical protein [Halalkalibacterium halodurans]MED4105508.1 hypothetical protein [Halalkalibacterium halodurans]MED4109286.1 hypothetical protein [Halalkalibacterium halodurans]MED4149700.1 hypothetical protein [Halalkalibacterium halodurans]
MKSPQQVIFDAVYAASLRLGYATYDYLPAKDTAYPFVYVGEQFDQDLQTKTNIYGRVQQTVHIYHNYRRRRELTAMMDALKVEFRSLKESEGFYITCRNINAQTIIDTSTPDVLLHGIIEVEFQFN